MNTTLRTSLILVASFLILGAGCNLPWGKNNQPIEENNNNQSGAVDTSDWKEYRDELYDFAFRHPSDWEVKEIISEQGKSWIYEGVNYKIIQLYKGEEMQMVILPEGHLGRDFFEEGVLIDTTIDGKAGTRIIFPSGYAIFSIHGYPVESEFRVETSKYGSDTKKYIDEIIHSIIFE